MDWWRGFKCKLSHEPDNRLNPLLERPPAAFGAPTLPDKMALESAPNIADGMRIQRYYIMASQQEERDVPGPV